MATKSKTTLKKDANSAVYDNNNREIEAADHNELLIDLIDSTFNAISNASNVGLKAHDSNASYSQGDMVEYNHSIWEANKDTSGSFTESDWDLILGQQTRVVTGDHTINNDDRFIIADTSGGNIDVTLPDASDAWAENRILTIINIGGNSAIVKPQGTDTIDGSASLTLDNNKGAARIAKFASGDYRTLEVPNLPEFLTNLVSNLADLTSSEVDQLKKINAVSISNTQWGYLGVLNQNLRTTDDVTHNTVRALRRFDKWHEVEIISDVHDYDSNGEFYIRVNLEGGPFNLTGVVNEQDGAVLRIYNGDKNNTNTLNLPHQNTNSASQFQFWNVSSSTNTVQLPPGAMARYVYDQELHGCWVLESISPEASLV